jgi:Crinkler effector protein N-terminal domain
MLIDRNLQTFPPLHSACPPAKGAMILPILPTTLTYSAICRGNCRSGKIHLQTGRLLPTKLAVRSPHRNQTLSLTLSTTLPRTTSSTEMSDTTYSLWCSVEGDCTLFLVNVSPTIFVGELQKIIKKEKSNVLQRVDASNLALWKVRYFQ